MNWMSVRRYQDGWCVALPVEFLSALIDLDPILQTRSVSPTCTEARFIRRISVATQNAFFDPRENLLNPKFRAKFFLVSLISSSRYTLSCLGVTQIELDFVD
jgi:hypothetical protein